REKPNNGEYSEGRISFTRFRLEYAPTLRAAWREMRETTEWPANARGSGLLRRTNNSEIHLPQLSQGTFPHSLDRRDWNTQRQWNMLCDGSRRSLCRCG